MAIIASILEAQLRVLHMSCLSGDEKRVATLPRAMKSQESTVSAAKAPLVGFIHVAHRISFITVKHELFLSSVSFLLFTSGDIKFNSSTFLQRTVHDTHEHLSWQSAISQIPDWVYRNSSDLASWLVVQKPALLSKTAATGAAVVRAQPWLSNGQRDQRAFRHDRDDPRRLHLPGSNRSRRGTPIRRSKQHDLGSENTYKYTPRLI